MKQFIVLLHIFLLTLSITTEGAFAASKSEEDLCFEILNEQLKTDSRFKTNEVKDNFPKGDLSEVLYNQSAGGSTIDLSSYEKFKNNRVENKAFETDTLYPKSYRQSKGLTKYDFWSRRNNIATVITSGRTIISQVVGFGRDSNFDFPVESKSGIPFGDKYSLGGPIFKEFVLYTHHNIKGEFLSCGIFHLTPLNERTYGDVAETGYFTNVISGNTNQAILGNKKCSSGFELVESGGIKREGKKYLPMKANVCSIDYANNDFVKQEILAVAYDNDSDYFNEYDIFRLQVEAMRNTDITSESLFEVREKFLEYIDNKTCLNMIHRFRSDLPSGCSDRFKSGILSQNSNFNLGKSLLSYLFPQTFAKREFNFTEEEIGEASGIVIFEDLPYETYKKIKSIPDKNFQEYLQIALTPNFEDFIQKRKDLGIVISPFEEIFLSCNINYSERQKIIEDLIGDVNDPETFDISQISYSNKKFGDCIIPYPDKENRSKVIEGSFSTNQLLAKQLSGEYIPEEIDPKLDTYIQNQNTISLEYQKKLENLTRDYSEGLTTQEQFDTEVEKIKEERDLALSQVESIYTKEFLSESDNITITQKSKSNNYLILVSILIFALIMIAGAFIIKNNKK